MKRCLIFGILCTIALTGFAQRDTIRLMHYNLLNYRNTTNQCTNSTNNPDNKDGYLKTIVSYVKPDILTVNEMGANWLNPNKILTNALNKDGVTHYDQAEFTNNSFSSLVNMLFFNTDKLVLHDQETISKNLSGSQLVRVIDVYTLYVKHQQALINGDTTFLTVFVAHLKAGSTSSDKTERAEMTEAAMDYLKKNHVDHNYFFAGDFNIQTQSETCYQNLTKHSVEGIRFYDPKDAAGSWHENSNYANLHTQSTHVSDTRGGCFSSGGFDDRFDFILMGNEVKSGSRNAHYIQGSYKALGQDSKRFNGDIKNPSNSLVPSTISNALYEMSDHLPVLMDVEVKDLSVGIKPVPKYGSLIAAYNGQGEVEVFLPEGRSNGNLVLHDGLGKTLFEASVNGEQSVKIPTTDLATGVYFIRLEGNDGQHYTGKVQIQ